MRDSTRPAFKTGRVLPAEVWNFSLWVEYALSVDGKQHNRGQEGAGMACVKLNARPGEEYIFRERALGSSAITEVFDAVNRQMAVQKQTV